MNDIFCRRLIENFWGVKQYHLVTRCVNIASINKRAGRDFEGTH